jgi:phage I-like protein
MKKQLGVKTSRGVVAVAACVSALSGSAPGEIMLFPVGEFRARDGRPHEVEAWRLDAVGAALLVAQAEAAEGDFVIDYEHQTLHADDNGQPAPAAGWFKKLEWREGDGLYAVDVQWTAKARAMIEAGEYRYISPVFQYDKKTGVVLEVLMAALTNYPALDGHSDLAVRAAAKFQTKNKEDSTVNREQLIALLGLAEDASDEQIKKGMAALKVKADSADGLKTEITGLKTAHGTEIAALKSAGGKPDPAKYVPAKDFEELKKEVVSLKSEQTSGTVAALVSQGVEDGKLLPVQKDWATELGNKDVAALKSYLEKTPAIAALKGSQTRGKSPEGADDEVLTADELAVCKNLGISAEDYKKANPAPA